MSVDGNAQFSEPKTRKSRRSIDLDESTVQALRDWRKVQDEDRETDSPPDEDDDDQEPRRS